LFRNQKNAGHMKTMTCTTLTSPRVFSHLLDFPSLPKSVRALARYQLAKITPVCSLDDPRQLLALGLHPSDAVTWDYNHSRAWARRIYEQNIWAGVRWWSYYDPACAADEVAIQVRLFDHGAARTTGSRAGTVSAFGVSGSWSFPK
jgi:hypothetical protein